MSIRFKDLITIEFRRMITLPAILLVGFLILLTWGTIFVPYFIGAMKPGAPLDKMVFSTYLSGALRVIVPILSIFFGAGIVASDIKSHWLRTLLSRPVKRSDYLLARILTISLVILGLSVVMSILPIGILCLVSGIKVDINVLNIFAIHLLFFAESVTLLAIASWLSCFLPGFFNVFLLAAWMLADNIINSLVMTFLWDKNWALIAKDFFFPSGFSEMIDTIGVSSAFPWENLLWGIAALAGFLALSIWNLSIIEIDKGSD